MAVMPGTPNNTGKVKLVLMLLILLVVAALDVGSSKTCHN